MRLRRAIARTVERLDHYLVKVPQRMPAQVAFGVLLIVGSHFFSLPEERGWMRDTGTAVVAMSVARWMAQQGKRRSRPDGKPVRNPTIRFKLPPPEDE